MWRRSVVQFALLSLLVSMFFAGSARSQVIFRGGFESGLLASLNFVVIWQDVQAEGADATEVRIRGFENLFAESAGNNDATGTQNRPSMAMAADGSFVVVWEDDADGNGSYQVRARLFNADGSERFGARTVNTASAGQQLQPRIAMAPNGDYVVIWHDDQDQDGFYDLLCRGFYANGAQKFSDRLINQASNTGALNPVVAMADDGSFVVAWEDDADHNGFYQIKARGFTASGGSRISEFTVNSAGPGQQLQPAIGMAPDGAFVIAWTDDQDHNFYSEVFARGFNANGSERFSDITVNGVGTASQYRPSVGLAADGGFVVAWIDQAYAVKSRPFDPNGTPLADEMILNNDSLQMTNRPTIDVTPDGDYVVVWEHLRDDGRYSLRGRRMDAAGGQAREFEISTLGAGDQTLPTVAVR